MVQKIIYDIFFTSPYYNNGKYKKGKKNKK